MQPCIHLRNQIPNKISSWIMLAFALFGFLIFLIPAVGSMMVGAWIFCLIFGLFLCYVAVPCCLILTRRYRVTQKGIEVGGLLRRTRRYSWDEVYSIGVYAYGSNAGLNGYFSGICIFLKPVPDWFSYDSVKSNLMTARWLRSMILIDYTQTALDELDAVYPREIRDHRPGQLKMHDPEIFEKLRKDLK